MGAQWVREFAAQVWDLSPNLWDPHKSQGVAAHVCKPCGEERGRFEGLTGQEA